MRALWVLPLLAGCEPQLGLVELQGVVVDGWGERPQGVEGVTLETFDEKQEPVGAAVSEAGGWFRVEAAAVERAFVQIGGEGLVTTGFSGLAGINPRFRVPNGTFVAIDEALWETERARWEGCPGLDEGGVVLGRAEIADLVQDSTGEVIVLETARLTLQVTGGPLRSACYLGEDEVYDAEATETGPGGRFMITNVPAGEHQMDLNWTPVEGLSDTQSYSTWVPEGGVAPRFPLLVQPPIEDQ